MYQIKCNEVWIKFYGPHHQGVRCSYREEIAAHYLLVSQDQTRVTVDYIDKNGDRVKSLNYNMTHVLQWECTEVFGNVETKTRKE